MKISYINSHYQLGGAETVVRQLHEGALARGHASTLRVSDGKKWPRARGLRPLYPRLLATLDHSRFRNLVRDLAPREAWTDRACLRLADGDSDLVHVHSFYGRYASLETFAALARAKPLIWTFHRFWGVTGGCDHPGDCRRYLDACGRCPRVQEWPMNGRDDTAAAHAAKLALLAPLDLTAIAPSRHLERVVRESPIGRRWRVEYIPNGVNLARFGGPDALTGRAALRDRLGLPRSGSIVLVVNREFTDPVKGFATIRDAIAGLAPDELAGTTFVLVGGQADRARRELPPSARVVVAGFVADPAVLAEHYRAADVFLYASPGENFPCAVIEAMAARCCVVSTPTDGVLEQIAEGETGLIAADFSPAALAAKLRAALGDPALRARLGERAALRARAEFSEDAMLERHFALYAETIAARRARARTGSRG